MTGVMEAARWKRIEAVFYDALDLPTTERTRYLATSCGDDPELRREVESLLESMAGATESMREVIAMVAGSVATTGVASLVGKRVGPYRLVEVIGEGGMGTVYLAQRDDDEYQRDVAIKILPLGLATPQAIARFRDERQILARLDHPSIVRLLDGGATEDGVPYLVMEHVDGIPLTAYTRDLPLRAKIELLARVASALQYAHQQLIVHRDIKPSNVLVDVAGTPKLLDFGIAKLLDDEPGAREAKTRTGIALLTPEYASPEQARGEPVTVASDVYSLGAVMYQVLTGKPPLTLTGGALDMLRQICEVEPLRPSVVAARRELAGELDNIVLKALHKRPDQRYASVSRLADDLERYLAGLPVAARAATWSYRARKYIRRHRGKLALATLVAASLTIATVASIMQARRADDQAAAAERDKLSLLRERGVQELASGRALRALPYFVEVLREGGDTATIRFLIAEASRPLERELASIAVADGAADIAWSPDGQRFAITAMNGHVGIYNADGKRLVAIETHASVIVRPTFSPDGTILIATDLAGRVFAWEVATGRPTWTASPHAGPSLLWGFTSSGAGVIVSTGDGWLDVIDSSSGSVRATTHLPIAALDLTDVARSADGHHVAAASRRGDIFIWDFTSTAPPQHLDGHAGGVFALRYSRDGTKLYSGGGDHAVRVRDVATGRELAVMTDHSGAVRAIDLAHDESHIASASEDGTAAIWDATSGKVVAQLSGLSINALDEIGWSPDGRHLVTTSTDGTFRLWDARGNAEVAYEGAPGAGDARHSNAGTAIAARFSPDGTRLLTASSREVRVRRVDTGALRAHTLVTADPYAVAWSPDDRRLAIVGKGIAGVWTPTLEHVLTIDLGNRIGWDVAWSPSGDRLAIVGSDGMITLRDARGALVRDLSGAHGLVNAVTWSPDGTRLVTSEDEGVARLWDPATGTQLITLAHGDRVMSAAWRLDGALLATACWDRHLRFWNPRTGELVGTIDAGAMQLLSVAFDPTGRSVIATSHGGDVATFDVATQRRVLGLEGHTNAVPNASWSPDGALIATAGYDGTARIWDPATGEQLAMRPAGSLMSVAWSHDGAQLAGVSEHGQVQIWDARRAALPTAAIVEIVNQRVPFRLVGTRLERVLQASAQ
jgi:WD40 repeat protein